MRKARAFHHCGTRHLQAFVANREQRRALGDRWAVLPAQQPHARAQRERACVIRSTGAALRAQEHCCTPRGLYLICGAVQEVCSVEWTAPRAFALNLAYAAARVYGGWRWHAGAFRCVVCSRRMVFVLTMNKRYLPAMLNLCGLQVWACTFF